MWYLVGPAAGSAKIVATLTDARDVVAGAVSVSGARLSAPFGAFQSARDQSQVASLTLPSGVGELVVSALSANGDARSVITTPIIER